MHVMPCICLRTIDRLLESDALAFLAERSFPSAQGQLLMLAK